jgi:hypothetical protein
MNFGFAKRRERQLRSLRRIYAEIGEWNRDREAVPRILTALNPCADLAIVAEAIGPKTVRLSGVNYFRADGRLGGTGRYLDKMLLPLGFTVYPSSDVKLASGAVIQAALGSQRQTAYCTDLCPEFPGYVSLQRSDKTKASIKRPSLRRVKEALKCAFLERELEVVKPKVILLLGAAAYTTFYTHFLKRSSLLTLQVVVDDLGSHLANYKTSVVVPFLHPSPASPLFLRWFTNFKNAPMKSTLVRCIRPQLKS